jgi:O-antigen/teichoic acid export membrane protein
MTKAIQIRSSIITGLLLNLAMNISLYVGQLLIARSLPRPEYAIFLVVTNFVILFSLFADLGLTPLFVRIFASNLEKNDPLSMAEKGSLFGSMLFVRITASLFVSIAVIFVSMLLDYSAYERYLMFIFLASLLISSRVLVIRSVGEAFLRSNGKYQLAALFATVDAVFFAVCVFFVRYYRTDVETIILVYTFCNVPGFVLLVRWIILKFREESIQLSINKATIISIVRKGLPLALGTAFLTIHNTGDTLLLDRLSTPTDVSAFGAGIRVLSALIFLPGVFALVTAPEITRAISQNNLIYAKKMVSRSLEYLLLMSLFFALVLSAAPTLFVTVLFGGDKFIDAAPLVTLFGWAFVGMSFSYFMIEVAVAEGKEWISMLYMLILMIVSVALDFVLIPSYGFFGAGLAKTFAVFIASIVVFVLSRRMDSYPTSDVIKLLTKTLVFGGLMGCIVIYAHSVEVHELICLLFVLFIYPIGSYLLGLLKYSDLKAAFLSMISSGNKQ